MEQKFFVAERSFDLRTSGLWAQHASTAPLCYHYFKTTENSMMTMFCFHKECKFPKNILSEVGFEPTPTEVDCDLNAAP